MSSDLPRLVVFFDGHCGLCDRSVTYLFARDRKHALRFAPLQGQFAAKHLALEQRTALDTVVLWDEGRIYVRSTAALRAMLATGGTLGTLAKTAMLVPTLIRDTVYDFIARNRFRIMGKRDSCRLPAPHERGYFLD